MKNKMKLMFTFMVMLCLVICLGVNASAAEVVDSGDCGADGANVTWELYDDGNLVISGFGKMADGFYNTIELDAVKSIEIEYGVTSIGIYSFTSFVNLESVSLSETVKNIGAISFGLCGNLKEVEIPYGVTEIAEGTFSNCTSLTSIVVPDSVKSIGESAFENCESITSVTIGSSVESIGADAFWYCDEITDVYYNGTVDEWNEISIDEDGNDSLTNATIHYLICEHEDADNENGCDKCGSVVAYSGSCGAEGDNVTWVLYDDGYLVISGEGDMADRKDWNDENPFKNFDSNIKSVVVEEGVTSVGDYAFDGCSNLTDITIANSVTRIGVYAFHGCGMADVTIPASVEIIDEEAFSGSDKFVSVTFENGVKSIGDFAFSVCYNISDLFIPASVTNIGEGAFAYDISLKNITVDENNEYYSSVDGVLFNKNKTKIITYPAMSTATSYTIPDSVTDTDPGIFVFALNLVDVVIPDSVENIGEAMFIECHNLQTVKIGSGVKYIGEWMIDDFYSLTDVIYNGTEEQWDNIEIGENEVLVELVRFEPAVCEHEDTDKDGLCDGCNEVYEVKSGSHGEDVTYTLYSDGKLVIGGTGDMLDTSVFDHTIRDEVKTVIIEDGITSIGEDAFKVFKNLTSVVIPGSVTSIGDYAFFRCYSLKEVVIPEGVTSIGEGAFQYCEILTEIRIPASVTSISRAPFLCCPLTEIVVDENNEYFTAVDGVLFNKDKTQLVTYPAAKTDSEYVVPDTVTKICAAAFGGAENLTSIVVGDSVADIDLMAFFSCSGMESIYISDSVVNVGEFIFEECMSLTDIYYEGTEEQWYALDMEEYVDFPEYGISLHFNYSAHEHTPGEWVVVTEATYEAEGKKEQRCTGCGELLAEEVLPKLVKVTVEDDKTGVALEFDSNDYDGEVEVTVEETFDDKAFALIDTTIESSKATIFDISMSVDGTTVQPNGNIKVKIPVPKGYNADKCVIYYINTENNTVEKLPTSFEGGYLAFETDHFSYYAVVEVAETTDDSADDNADDCSCMCHKSGFMGFIWMIINFFQKLFKSNQICSCGISHY